MPRVVTITSSANPLFKDVRRAIERHSLTSQGWCVAEGVHLLHEALAHAQVRQVFASEAAAGSVEQDLRGHRDVQLSVLTEALFPTIASTTTSQGVIALVEPRVWKLDELFGRMPLVAVIDGLQDPGNAGAIVRTAEAFSATGVIFMKGSAGPFNPKTLRASAGSLFRIPYIHGAEAAEVVAAFRDRGVAVYSAMPGGHPMDADLAAPSALIIGSEARGVSEALRAASTPISIPTTGVESLNAALAAGILLYEAARQRTARSVRR